MSGSEDEEGPIQFELRLNGTEGVQETAGAAVRSFVAAMGLRPEKATRMRAVVEELVRESLGRPRATTEGDAVVVRAGLSQGRMRVEVGDAGLPITPAESRRAPSRRLSALGFVDELHIRARGKAGNLAVCEVALLPRDSDLGDEQVLDPDAARAGDEQVAELVIRGMEPSDAGGLVRCVYRCYGYSYKDSLLYEPRHIAHALRAGLMRSVVAVTKDGDIVGHCAVFAESRGDPVPESGRLVVDPRYRGHGLAEKMATLRLEVAGGSGLAGIWAEAVTNHTSSQREVIRLGGAEVGLLIGGSPGTVAMADLQNNNQGRRSLIVTYTPFTREPRTVHVCARHGELITGLAGRLGLEREIETAAGPPPSCKTHLITRVRPEEGLAHITVARIGADAGSRIADDLEGLDAFDLGAVHLDVPLSDPGAPAAIEQLESLGFCFAAWMPDFSLDGDVIRLQRTGGHPVDTEHIECARPEGEALRDHVLAEWHRVRRAGLG
jgi:anti-sigma regulatory factor (Ser/Thr protein kinase)/RimJ/RimL family protein N-acetyltransferase